MTKIDAFTRAYIDCMLWSSTDNSRDDGGDPLDRNYSEDDLAPEALAMIVADCERFQADNGDDLLEGTDEQGGHDFWLTRNRHGCGFWDGDWPEPAAARLTDAAHAFGEVWPYVGDDGLIYV
jgi:hypothetical protein